MKLFYCFYVG